MSRLLSLPAELVENVLVRLDPKTCKTFRTVSRECESLANQHVFREISFDLEPGGCDRLTAIASQSRLQQNVRTIHLARRTGFKSFSHYAEWCESTIYEYEPWSSMEVDPPSPSSMSQEQWKSMAETDRQCLYEEYEREKQRGEEYIARLSLAAIPLPDSHIQSFPSDAQQILLTFQEAIQALTLVNAFRYTPKYEDEDRWGRTWRRIEFHPDALVANSHYGNDVDIDALQLFLASKITLLAPNALRSMDIFTRGSAFWSTAHLLHLLDWTETPVLRPSQSLGSVEARLKTQLARPNGPLLLVRHCETLTRHIVEWELALSRLKCLEFRIETGWSEKSSELVTIATSLSSALHQMKHVEQLTLVFRNFASADDVVHRTHHGYEQIDSSEMHDNWLSLSKASAKLLQGAGTAFRHLRYLHLSLATSASHILCLFEHLDAICHLRLEYIALIPGGGCWEAVLHHIACHLRLDRIELRALEDIREQKPRLLLEPTSDEWMSGPTNSCRYTTYEDAIVRFALGKASSCPPLAPAEFLSESEGQEW